MRGGVIALLGLLAGCDKLFGLDHIPDPDAGHAGDGVDDVRPPDDALDASTTSSMIQYVQVAGNRAAQATSLTVTFPSVTQPDSLVVVFVGTTTSGQATMHDDNAANTYTRFGDNYSNGIGQGSFYILNSKPARTLTVNWTASANNIDIRAAEFSGAVEYGGGIGNTGTGLTPVLGSANAVADSLLVAGFMVSGMIVAPGPSYAEPLRSSDGNDLEYRFAPATGPWTAQVTQDQNGAWAGQLMVFTPP